MLYSKNIDLRDRIAALTREGRTATEIGAMTGVCKRTVVRHRRAAGIPAPPSSPPMTPSELARAQALLDDGACYREVARTLGRSAQSVRRRFPGHAWTRAQSGAHGNLVRRYRLSVI